MKKLKTKNKKTVESEKCVHMYIKFNTNNKSMNIFMDNMKTFVLLIPLVDIAAQGLVNLISPF